MLCTFQEGRASQNKLCLNGNSILDKFCICGGRSYMYGAMLCSQVYLPPLASSGSCEFTEFT